MFFLLVFPAQPLYSPGINLQLSNMGSGSTLYYFCPGKGVACLCFAVVLFCLTPVAFSQDFNVQQISRDNIHNSDPVISETGLAAWMYYDTNTGATAHSHIILYQNGKIIELTAESTTILSGATKPLVQSNKVVFVANYKQFVSASQNWVP